VLAIAVPAVAIGLYRMLGNAEIIPRLETLSHASTPADQAKGDLPPMEVLVERLAEKLAQNPDNLEGWLMLGRSYSATGQTEKALAAYGRAYQLAPREPEVMLTYAEALAVSNDNQLSGEPERLVAAALETAPNNPNALWLSGVAALQRGEREAAVRHWEALYALLPADGEDAENLRGFIAQARGEPAPGQAPVGSAPPASAPSTAKQAPAASVRVEVSLAEPLRARVKPEDAVFVYAKALQGPPMPLAVHRAQARDLPLAVTLDDSLAITPQLKLSSFPQVSVGARVSPSGNAIAQPGDLEGEQSPVAPGQAKPIRVTIDRVRP
jgi:cytochrome c-type biogenesis protein CcmH